ncbi:transcription factor IIIB 90 kDa subunit [Copidosoma floridanum]|uniref:transcription factor IIIB 90 kDa subunit n=1 Tax=Copidosoma floridanum TaxID=29053 RepID=UPI0006C9E01F|nr:transcription factor IIIB 90 kDa subunit [Copidosoma floridanum]
MSNLKCKCGSTSIETDPARGDVVCTECGFVLEDQIIVNETMFEESPSGNMMMIGHFVSNESSGGASGLGPGYMNNSRESREITLANARKGIAHLCRQLQLNNHCIETAVNIYKLALTANLTRGRKQAHNHAACVYITCRTECTTHMLIDISDVLQICVHELGRTYLKFTQALCIKIPSMDPCLYILRFANKLEFGEKTHEVYMTALRIVQRMKRDSIHSGRRPSGLCGAALLMAARLHEFNRSPNDIIKIVKVHESTLRKRLIEFGDTPSSALTLDEFMAVDLEEEQDPPAFKAARKKDRERLQKLENMANEFTELQSEIDRQLEKQKSSKRKARHASTTLEESDAERFIRESNISVIDECVRKDSDTLDVVNGQRKESSLAAGLGPDIASMGLSEYLHNKNTTKELSTLSFENLTGEVDITDLDDDELDGYIMTEKETQTKTNLWNKVNEKYLEEQKKKEEKRLKEKEEGKPEKKRRRSSKRNKNQTPANSANEAIEKMLKEKRISSKINYEVLKSLNVGLNTNTQAQEKPQIPDDIAFVSPKAVDKDTRSTVSTFSSPKKPAHKVVDFVRKKPTVNISTSRKRDASHLDEEPVVEPVVEPAEEPVPIPPTVPVNTSDFDESNEVDDADDYFDDEEPEQEEMSVSKLLGHDEDEYDGYDEEEY